MLDWLRTLPPYDAVNLPNALLLGMAPALRRERLGPLVCTLQGEDLFLEALQEPYRSESMALIRRLAPEIDAFVAVSASYAEFMTGYLGLPKERVRTVPLGINFDGHAPREAPAGGPFTIGYFARVAPEKGLHLLADAYVRLRRTHGVTGTRLAVAGYLAPEHRAYLARDRGAPRGRRARATSSVPRRPRPRPEDRVPARARRACRCRARTSSRRACTCWRRSRTACRPCSRGTARSRRSWRRRAAAGCSSPGTRTTSPTLRGARARPGEAARLGAAGAAGVRRHYGLAAHGGRDGARVRVADSGGARVGGA